ncbi:MAG: hypothetical protein OXE85_06605, partial [Roseovarius sp.]|nr:hypothetical protein [Roseovarius sp.]
MKRTTLRTSAIALGVAAALPATGQEWNLQWGGFMNQHVVFGSTEVEKSGANLAGASTSIEIDADGGQADDPKTAKAKIRVKFIEASNIPEADDAEDHQTVVADGTLVVDFSDGDKTEYYLEGITLLGTGARGNGDSAATTGAEDSLERWIATYAATADNNVDGIGERNADDITVFVPLGTGDNTHVADAVAKVNSSIDASGNGQRRNSEVHFKPSVT